MRYGYDLEGNLYTVENHETGGLKAYEYIIDHRIEP